MGLATITSHTIHSSCFVPEQGETFGVEGAVPLEESETGGRWVLNPGGTTSGYLIGKLRLCIVTCIYHQWTFLSQMVTPLCQI